MDRCQTIAEIIGGQPGTFVYDAPFLGFDGVAEDVPSEQAAGFSVAAEQQDR